jgi:hypothetical protein
MILDTIRKMRQTDPAGYIMESVKRFGMERMFSRYYGIYRGVVIDNVDPENRGRCRVIVPATGQLTEDDVPPNLYALPCMTGLSVGKSGELHGCFFPPNIGDQVFVTFEQGMTTGPIYMGGWVHAGSVNGPELRTQDASVKGIRTKYGHYISFNDESGAIQIERGNASGGPSGTKIVFDGSTVSVLSPSGSNVVVTTDRITVTSQDGSAIDCGNDSVTLTSKTGTELKVEGANVSVTAVGEITLESKSKIVLKAPLVDVGNGPTYEPMVMGQTFSTQYVTHVHGSAAPTVPTTPQLGAPPVPLSGLSLGVRVSV